MTILRSIIPTVQMESRESKAQPPEITVRKKCVIDRKNLPHKEQKQQASDMPDLREGGEMVSLSPTLSGSGDPTWPPPLSTSDQPPLLRFTTTYTHIITH